MILVGIGHEHRSGKDTVAQFLVENFGFTRVGFADALYEECRNLLIAVVPREKRLGHFDRPYMLEAPDCDGDAGKGFAYMGMTEKDPLLLQWWGTNVRRSQNPDYWIDRVASKLSTLPSETRVVLPDTRFPNEAEFIRARGGLLWKVARPNRPIDRPVDHPSETALQDYSWDEVIQNDGTLDDLQIRVRTLACSLSLDLQ
jgi:hypothetical protein